MIATRACIDGPPDCPVTVATSHRLATPLLPLTNRRFGRIAAPLLLLEQFVGHVVLVDVADVGDGLSTDTFRGNALHVAEPDVWIETPGRGLLAQLADTGRAGVVGRERHQRLVQTVHRF